MNYEQLDPGIRLVVQRLNEAGFVTTDSGDGDTKVELIASGDAMDFPHVYIKLEEHNFLHETQRLMNLVGSWGVKLEPVGTGSAGWIQVTYDPIDGSMYALLAGVNDGFLTPSN